MLRRAGATTTGKYSLMLRDGGNTLGSSIIGNLGIGGKNNFGLSQNFKSSLLRGMDNNNQENNNNEDNNNENNNNVNIKKNRNGNIGEEDENSQDNREDDEQ